MKPHSRYCGCPWCQENRESERRAEPPCGGSSERRALDDWPTPPRRPQRGLRRTAVAGCICGAVAGIAAAIMLVLWMVTQ
jgi:hypothetical protein